MPTIWVEVDKLKQEIKWLKDRVNDLEEEQIEVTIHEALILLNSEHLDRNLNSLMLKLKSLVQKYGSVEISVTSQN